MKYIKNFENNKIEPFDEEEWGEDDGRYKNKSKRIWNKIYSEYRYDCLDGDGDFSMSFVKWLKNNYYYPKRF